MGGRTGRPNGGRPDQPDAGSVATDRPARRWPDRAGPWLDAATPFVLAGVAAYVALLTGMTFFASHPPDGDEPSTLALLLVAGPPAALLFLIVLVSCRWLIAALRAQPVGITTRTERGVLAAAVVVLAMSWTFYQGMDGFLGHLRQPGDGAHGSIVVGALSGDPGAQICAAAASWSRYVRPDLGPEALTGCSAIIADEPGAVVDPPPFPNRSRAPIAILAVVEWVDSLLLAPAYGIALGVLLIWSRRALAADRENVVATAGDVVDRLRRTAAALLALVAVAVLADWIENGLTLGLLARAWAPPGTPACLGLLPGGCAAYEPLFGIGSWPAFAVTMLQIATLLKTAAVAVVALGLLFIALVLMQHGGARDARWQRLPGAIRTLVALRVPILAVVVYWLLITYRQTPEILWQWRDYPLVAVAGAGLTALLAVGLRWIGDRLISHGDALAARGDRPAHYGGIVLLAALPLVAALVLGVLQDDLGANVLKAAVPLAIVGAVAALSAFARSWPGTQPVAPGLGRSRLPAVLGAVVLILLGTSLITAVTPLLLFTSLLSPVEGATWLRDPLGEGYWALVGLALLLMAGAARMGVLRSDPQPAGGRLSFWWRVLAVAAGAWCLIAAALVPDWGLAYVAPALGPIGVVSLALLLMMAAGASVLALVTLLAPPAPLFRVMSLSQTPVLACVALWWLLGAALPPDDTLHDVRLERVNPETLPAALRDTDPALGRIGERLDAAFAQWRWQNCLVAPTASAVEPDPARRPVVPLVLVATDGGGIFAASWTAYVTDRVFGYGHLPAGACTGTAAGELDARRLPRSTRLFAASGVSGGSVGLSTYVARSLDRDAATDPALLQDLETCPDEACRARTAPPRNPPCGALPRPPVDRSKDGWVRVRLGRCEMLSPTLAWLLFVETPWAFIHTGVRRDRAVVLEETWERVWRAPGVDAAPLFFALRRDELDWEAAWNALQRRATEEGRGLTSGEVTDLYRRQGTVDRVRVPLLLFNGTSVESGCRFNGSTLESNERPENEPAGRCLSPSKLVAPGSAVLAATSDLADMLCKDQDIRLATVAILSARFPVISPSGHAEDDCPASALNAPETYVVDGAYLDATGAATMVGLWSGLAPLIDEHNRDPLSRAFIVPFFIHIKNAYGEPAGPGAAPGDPQFLAPLEALLATESANRSVAVQQMQLIFGRPFVAHAGTQAPGGAGGLAYCGPRFARFSLRAYPGPRGRPGWIFSNVAFNDLVRQLTYESGEPNVRLRGGNQEALETVDTWLALPSPGVRSLSPASACSATGVAGGR